MGREEERRANRHIVVKWLFLTFYLKRKSYPKFHLKSRVQKKKISSNVCCFFIVNLIISNISVREWGLKEVFCQKKYIKDEKSREYRKYSLWWEHIYAGYGRLSLCCVSIALPHVWCDFKVFWNLPNLCRQEGCFESNHIPREVYEGNAFILQNTLCVHEVHNNATLDTKKISALRDDGRVEMV